MVGKVCTVCKQSSAGNKNLSFFTYPSDEERRYEWLKAVDRLDLFEKLVDLKSRGNHRICEAHFKDSCIKETKGGTVKRKCLTKDAFPSLEHVNQARLDIEKLSGAGKKARNRSKNKPKMKHIKIDTTDNTTDNYVSVEMDSDVSDNKCNNYDTISEVQESTIVIKVERVDDEVNVSSPNVASPELTGFTDMSEFCESVIKVNKETQTALADNDSKQKKRKMDPTETSDYFIQSCSKYLSKGMAQLIKWQINSKENTDNYKLHMFALNLYFSGANSYSILKSMMGLPEISTLKKLVVPKTTKFDNSLINALKIKVNNMSTRERICSLSISSMPLKPNLYYNISRDKIEGFHEIDGVQKLETAKYALVFIAQGILEKWTQPIAHAFIAHHENSPDLSMWVEEIITLVIDVGLDVRAFVSDPKTEPLYMLESQQVTPAKTYFSINGKNIYYIYDSEKLRKTVGNYLKNCHFYIKGSNSDDNDNAIFAKRFTDLCNILNSKTHVTMSPYKRAYSARKYQCKFLNFFLFMLQNLKVIRKFNNKDVTKSMKFIDSIQISITSIMKLYDELKVEGAKILLTSRLSQNALNKLFAKAGSEGRKDSSRQFKKRFSRCFVHSMMKKPIGDSKMEITPFNPQSLLWVGKSVNQAIRIKTTDYKLALPEKKRLEMVCRYLYLKCIDHHTCSVFQGFLSRCPESRQYVPPYRSSGPIDIRTCKLVPPTNFTDFILILEKRFRDYCKHDVKVHSIGHQILKKISSFEFEAPCKCFPLVYLKKLFVRLRIFYAVRENNIMYKTEKTKIFKTFNL